MLFLVQNTFNDFFFAASCNTAAPSRRSLWPFVSIALILMSATAFADEASDLHALLNSGASLRDKGVACRRLALIGNEESVPILEKLLGIEELSHLARVALERIPSKRVDDVFRKQLDSAQGDLLIGVINSIGNRRDVGAVPKLLSAFKTSAPTVRPAILYALSDISTAESAEALRSMFKAPADVSIDLLADCSMRLADRMVKDGNQAEALSIYQSVRNSSASTNLVDAATLAIIRLPDATGLKMLSEQLQSPMDSQFKVGLQASRLLPASQAAPVLCRELLTASAGRSVLILDTLSDLREKSSFDTVKQSLDAGSPQVRAAAVRTLGRIGDPSIVNELLELCIGPYPEIASDAFASLVQLEGEGVDTAILNAAKDATDYELIALRLIGERRIPATRTLWIALLSMNQVIRTAAIEALGRTATTADMNPLLDTIQMGTAEERKSAVSAVAAICRRSADPDKITPVISARFADSPLELQLVRFDLLKTIGGGAALQEVLRSADDSNETILDAATRALGDWPTADVAPGLLALCSSIQTPKYKIRALRAYIRIFRQFGLPTDQRLQMARDAFALSTRNDEKVLVLHALLSFQNRESMLFALEYLKAPGLEATAAQVAIYIADQVSDKDSVIAGMRKILASEAEETYAKQARDILAKLDAGPQ
jgi:HEAT repeat protein